MKLKTRADRDALAVYVECPAEGGEDISVMMCTQTATIKGKDDSLTLDWKCPFFLKLQIGSVDCSHPEPQPRHAERGTVGNAILF